MNILGKNIWKKWCSFFVISQTDAKKSSAPWTGFDGVKVVLFSLFSFAAIIFGTFFGAVFLINHGLWLPNIDAMLLDMGLEMDTQAAFHANIVDGFGIMSLLLLKHIQLALVMGIVLQVLLQLGFLFFYSRIKYGSHIRDFGFHRVGLGSFFGMIVFLFLLSILVQNEYLALMGSLGYHNAHETGAAEQMLIQGQIPLPIFILFAGFIAPILEELIFRGFLLAGFLHTSGIIRAVIFSALIFALSHTNPSIFLPDFVNGKFIFSAPDLDEYLSTFILMPIYFLLGIFLAFSFLRTKSLYPGIAFHMINNNAALFLLLAKLHS